MLPPEKTTEETLPMRLNRRALLGAMALSPVLPHAILANPAQAQEPTLTPILFVHGNGDHAALWMTTLWRFESNGWPREAMRALDFTDPLARDDDAVPQPMRSSSEAVRRELAAEIAALRQRMGDARIALVGNSRGGYPIRNHLQFHEGAREVSHAVLCGTPNNGIYDWEAMAGREFNARSALLRRLNAGESQVVPGTAFLTLRSDSNDLYAQPDGRYVGRPGVPTGVGHDSPELRGATNLVLPGVDHRETAYSARAFREMFRFIAGREPDRLSVLPEERPVLNGRVTGTPGGVQTNRPVTGAVMEVFRVSAESGERMGEAIHRRTTGEDGRWGPVTVSSGWSLEIVVAAPGHPITHYYRSPFPRSSDVVNLRPAPRRRRGRSTVRRGPWFASPVRAAISACRGTWCCWMGRSPPMFHVELRPAPRPSRACRRPRSGVRWWACSTRSGWSRAHGRFPRTGSAWPS